MHRFLSLTFVLLLSLVAAGTRAATFQVTTTADSVDPNPGDGVCGSFAVCSLRQAVQEANALGGHDTILLPAGTFALTRVGQGEDAAATGDLDVSEDLDIIGAGPWMTVIDGGRLDRVIDLLPARSPELMLRGLTITRGEALTASTFLGGGINAWSYTTLRVDHCAITGNSANAGGGVYVGHEAEADIRYSSLTGNSTEDSGFVDERGVAIEVWEQGALALISSTVSDNTSSVGDRSVVHMSNSTSLVVADSTIVSNPAGGIWASNTDAIIEQSTIADNGGFALGFTSYYGEDSLTLLNTIVSGLPTCYIYNPGTYTHIGNLESADSCGLASASGEQTWTDPDLGELAWNGGPTMTRQPNASSPAIDAAAGPPACIRVDQRGVPRPEDGDGDHVPVCDVGATEAAMLVFVDTFESATTSFWSAVSP